MSIQYNCGIDEAWEPILENSFPTSIPRQFLKLYLQHYIVYSSNSYTYKA